jgi:hypothetical protein
VRINRRPVVALDKVPEAHDILQIHEEDPRGHDACLAEPLGENWPPAAAFRVAHAFTERAQAV